MRKDHNLDQNQESCLGTIHQRKLPALVLWVEDLQPHGLEITVDAWNKSELKSSIKKINV